MKVSIVIPIYKVEKEIERCITSVLAQDYSNIEIVLVNDCTPDLSFQIAKDYIQLQQAEYKTLFIEHDVNQGLSGARNSGIVQCTGDYVFFLDSDDALTNSKVISYLVSYIEDDPSLEVVMGNYQKVDDDGVFEIANETRRYFDNNSKIYTAYACSKLWIVACGKLIKKDFLLTNHLFFYPGIYHEDELWSFGLFRVLSRLYVTPIIIYDYYEREGSITSQLKEKNIEDWIIIICEMVVIFNQQPNYHKKETLMIIENCRREILRKIFLFKDKNWQKEQLARLQNVHVPFFWKKHFLKQNLFMKMPRTLAYLYYSFRYNK